MRSRTIYSCVILAACLLFTEHWVVAHEPSRSSFLRKHAFAIAKARAAAEEPAEQDRACQLTIDLVAEDTGESVAGLVRIINRTTGKATSLSGQIHRAMNWYALPARATVSVPRSKLLIEGLHGLETEPNFP